MKNLPLQNPSYLYLEKGFKEWLDVLGYAPTTVYNLPNHLHEFLYYLETQQIKTLQAITPETIQAYYKSLSTRANKRRSGGLSNAHLNKHQQALERFFAYVRQTGKIQLCALPLKRETKQSETTTILSREEVKELYKCTVGYHVGTHLEWLESRDRAILSVFYGCGLRRNEGYHLDLSDINFDRGLLHVRKGKRHKERMVPFNEAIAKHLQEYIYDYRNLLPKAKREPALFISQKGGRMQSQSMYVRLKLLLQRTDDIHLKSKEITLHGLRHSIATHLLESGMALKQISQFLGHSSLDSTQIYTRLIEQDAH